MIEDVYPLSPLQEGFYYHWLALPGSPAYFQQTGFQLEGDLNVNILEESYHLLVARHAILRTFFTQDFGDTLLQVVRKEVESTFSYLDASSDKKFSIDAYKEADKKKGFNLSKGSQIRLSVVKLKDNKHELIWSNHHILMDGWCMGILIREFFQIYQLKLQGKNAELNKVVPYSRYIQWLNKLNVNAGNLYWKNYLLNYSEVCSIPKKNIKDKKEYLSCEVELTFDEATRQHIKTLCRELAITENTFFQTAWGILLGKYNNTTDVVFGSVVSGRPSEIEGVEEMIGLFINTIPVRVQSAQKQTIASLLQEMHQKNIESAGYHYTQLAQIQSESPLGQNLFDHILVFENYPVKELVQESMESMENANRSKELTLLSSNVFDQTTFDLSVVIYPAETIRIKFSYDGNLFDEQFINRLKDHLAQIIRQMIKDPKQLVSGIDYLTVREKEQLLETFNNTATAFPHDKTIVELFEEQAAKTPDNHAVIFENTKLTYRELNEKANRLAAFLQKTHAVAEGDLVGIVLGRTEWAIISMLAVLKTGAAYVPVDPEYPQERIDYMLTDSKCKAVITEAKLNKFIAEENKWGKENGTVKVMPNSLAYVIYTSGSTGKPKGVMAPHKGIVRLVKNTNYVDVTVNDCILSMSNFVFDGSTFDIYGALLNGASLVVTNKSTLLNMELLDEVIDRNNVSMFFITTALFNMLGDHSFKSMRKVKKIMFGGELVSLSHVKKFREKYKTTELLHVYGPTENTTFSTWYKIEDIEPEQTTVPIGNSISNSTAYVFDATNKLSPLEIPGELYVGGSGLALGYLNNEELTRSRFIENPYVAGELIYKTGDIVKWLPDGSIEFIGRKDDQVKIRGHRIELGEIEHALTLHPLISETLVIVREDKKGQKNLVAYFISTATPDLAELKTYLSSLLPAYMLPMYFIRLEEFPLSVNGKIDKALLPSPEVAVMTVNYTPPEDEMEERLVTVWAEVLGIDKSEVGVDHNFFELGGNSISIIKLSKQISKTVQQAVTIPVLFEYTTIRSLVGFLNKTAELSVNEELAAEEEEQNDVPANEEIAIIGMSGQFSGSIDHRDFWRKLSAGEEMLTTFTEEELMLRGVPKSNLSNDSFVKTVGVTPSKEFFDHGFFEFTAEEAALMDPQIRLFYQHCWSALEDAGQTPFISKKKIGLFAGASENRNWKIYTYGKLANSNLDAFFADKISNANYINTLIAYKLNLRGPAVFVDTACSTSLVAVDIASDNLLKKRCSIALAGGVNIVTTKEKGYYYQEGMISSIDGHCRAFDETSTGTAHGEGAGVVVLKRLSEAVKDGDHIYAVIKSTSVNNDGHLKVGYTAPSVKGQSDCIQIAHRISGVDPKTIGYVETHGTGTKLGDPVEIRALNEAFGTGGSDKFCAIGSVKTNIGHLDIAAGVAGLIKTVLSLKNKKIPASLHFTTANPEIDFASGPFYVNAGLTDWERKNDQPLRAGVSSFGIGGTNAHVVLEEAPASEKTNEREHKLITISAKTEKSLKRYQQDLLDFLTTEPGTSMTDLCYTLQTGRKHFTYRKTIAFKDPEKAKEQLLNAGNGIIKSKERNRPLVFMFPGQGSQYVNMGKDLYENETVFKSEMDKGISMLKKLTGDDYSEIIYPASEQPVRINETKYTQPLIFIFEYALTKLLMSYGLKPEYMIGHSIGEYVAACISGVMTYEDSLRIVVKRGELMNKVEAGAMISVPMTEEQAQLFLDNDISLAAVNGKKQVVLSGTHASMDKLSNKLSEQQIPYVKLYTSHAFHSAMLDHILSDFEASFKNIKLESPQIPFISNLTGKAITLEEATSPAYWTAHMRNTVKFSEGIQTLLLKKEEMIYLEVGAGNSLTSFLRQHHNEEQKPIGINTVRHPKELENDMIFFTGRIGQLWANGTEINWKLFYGSEQPKKISLPTYSFEKVKYPAEVDPFEDRSIFGNTTSENNSELKDWIYYPVWKNSVLEKPEQIPGSRVYVLFSSNDAFIHSVKENLIKNGDTAIEVLIGATYKKESAFLYFINPSVAEDYQLLFTDLKNEGIRITDILHFWSIGINQGKLQWKDSNEELSRAYFSLIYIAKGLLNNEQLNDKRIFVITDSLHVVTGNEHATYAASLLLGVLNVMSQEYAVSSFNIDADPKERSKTTVAKVADEIIYNAKDRLVSIRNGKRWLRDYQKNTTMLTVDNKIKRGGIILITGGLGNVGTVLSEHLVKKYDAQIVVMGRSALTPELQLKLTDMAAKGSAVSYYQGDIAQKESLKKVVAEIEKKQGTITGIVHAAGVTNMGHFELIEDISLDKSLEMFAPKVQGLENIYALFKDKRPDFVWVTSSIASVLGGLSFAAYSSANLFMDHFISSKGEELSGWKCLNLSEMLFTEDAIKNENEKERTALKPVELSHLFDWSIGANDQPQLIVTVRDLFKRLGEVYGKKKESYSNDGFSQEEPVKLERPDLSTTYAAPETETEKKLVSMIESFFGIEQIGIDDSFFELGGDSLKAMVLLKRIKKEMNVNLSLKEFFTKQNIREVAGDIDDLLWIATDAEMDNEMTI